MVDEQGGATGLASMARPLRMESESGVYHVLNRGNYRADIFRSDKAKAVFLGPAKGVRLRIY